MAYLLDTNACIVHLRTSGISKLSSRLAKVPTSDAALCTIVTAELRFGALRSKQVASSMAAVEAFVSKFNCIPFDEPASKVHAQIRAELTAQGNLIGPHDCLIAAIALTRGLTLVTHNTREFSRVGNLSIEDWEV